MRLYIDLATDRLVTGPGTNSQVRLLEFKRAGSSKIEIQFSRGSTFASLAALATGKFAIKPTKKYDASPLVLAETWEKTADEQPLYVFEPSFNTVALNLLLAHGDGNENNDEDFITAMLEIEWIENGIKHKTQTVTAIIWNDVIKDDDGTPSQFPDPADWMPAPLELVAEPVNGVAGELIIQNVPEGINPAAPILIMAPSGEAQGLTRWQATAYGGVWVMEASVANEWLLTFDGVDAAFVALEGDTPAGLSWPHGITVSEPTPADAIGQFAHLPGSPDRWWIAETLTSWREVFDVSNLTSGPVTSSGGVSAIADNALTIAKTSGLQAALNGKAPTANPTFTGTVASQDGKFASLVSDSVTGYLFRQWDDSAVYEWTLTSPLELGANRSYTAPKESGVLALTDQADGRTNLANVFGTLPITSGGTGGNTASAARTALGLGDLATQNGTFSGTSSGTNTGDQDLSGKANLAGGNTFTGNQTFAAFTETAVVIGNTGTSQTLAITAGTSQTATLTGNCTFTMPAVAAGKSFTLFLNTGTGGFTGTFTSVKWAGGAAPTITATASRMDILAFTSDGTNWYGSAIQNFTP